MMMNNSPLPTYTGYYPNSRGSYYDHIGVAQFPYTYRPTAAPSLQMPLRPATELGLSDLRHQQPTLQNINHYHQQQPQQQQRQILLPAHQQQNQLQYSQPLHIPHNMADWQTEEDLADFQDLSNKFEPEIAVSKRQPY